MKRTDHVYTITEGQKDQYKHLIEEAANAALVQADLDAEAIQQLLGNSDKFHARIAPYILDAIRMFAIPQEFAHEETNDSKYVYPEGYTVKPIAEQVAILRQFFPNLGNVNEELAAQPLPATTEDYFAIPPWQLIAPTYGEAVQKVMDCIGSRRSLKNYHKRQLGPEYLRETPRKKQKLSMLREQQEGFDILVVAAQFGLYHRGRSVRRARAIFRANEFGLGAYEIGIMLLTHPERLTSCKDLWIDCPGDEYSLEDKDGWLLNLCWCFHEGTLKLGHNWVNTYHGHFGSVSASLSG